MFELYEHAFKWASAVIISEAPRILQTVSTVFQNRGEGSASGLQCCRSILGALSSTKHGGCYDSILAQLLQYLPQIFVAQVQQFQQQQIGGASTLSAPTPSTTPVLWGFDPEVVELFFHLIQDFFSECPHILVSSASAMSQVLQLSLATLSISRERATLRSAMQVIQPFFCPTKGLVDKLQPFQTQLFAEAYPVGPNLTRALIEFFSNGVIDSTLRPCVADTIYHIITGCETAQKGQGQGNEAAAWVNASIFGPGILPMLTPELKNFVVETMFSLANGNHRRYKVFMMDVFKIGSCELGVEALGCYADL